MNSLARRPSVRQRIAHLRDAVRGIWQGPIYSSDPNLREFFGSQVTTAGVTVSEGSALTVAAVWNAVNCISGDIAALPLNMYRRAPDGGKEKFLSNPLHRLVHDQPNPEMTAISWRRTIQAHALTWGNGYSEIVRDGSGRAAQFWPITPDRVTPYRRGIDAVLEYRVVNRDGSDAFIPAEDMLHVHGLGYDGLTGYSVIAKARESIGLGMAAERFGESLYGNGLAIGGVISFPGARPTELSDQNYVASLNSKHQGVERAHKLLALYNGAKYERMNIPPNDAQFLETRTFQLAEVARWFNLPPHKIGDLHRATFSNIEQQTIDYYTGCLLPWLKTWEQELFLKLVPGLERNIQFFEHVVDGLLRGDSQMRADSFSKQFSTASITPNEIRDSENRNPLKGGDISFVPLNTIPLSKVEAWFDADIDEKKAKAEQARRPPPTPVAPASTPDPNPKRDAEIELLTEARDTARRCAQEAEDAKDMIAAELAAVRVEWAHARSQWDAEREQAQRTSQEGADAQAITNASLTETRAALVSAEWTTAETAKEIIRLKAEAMSLGADLSRAAADVAKVTDSLAEAVGLAEIREAGLIELRLEIERTEAHGKAETARADNLQEGYDLEARARQQAAVREADLIKELAAATARIELIEADYQRVCAEEREAESQIVVVLEANRSMEDELVKATERAESLSRDVASAQQDTAKAEERITASDNRTAVSEAVVAELRVQIDIMTQELATATTDLREAKTQVGTLESTWFSEKTAWETELRGAEEARKHADEVNGATVAELRTQVATLGQELATSVSSSMAAMTQIATLEAERDASREAFDSERESSRQVVTAVTQLQLRLASTQQAIRGTLVDAANRLIAKETERARKAQGSPEKLGAWLTTFYPIHEDFCRVALKPAVRAMLVSYGVDADVDRVLDRIVLAHISESSRQLQGVLQDSDIESLPPALERILRRWEAERAEALADRIMKEAA